MLSAKRKISILFALFLLVVIFSGCDKEFFSSPDPYDQPGENPVDESTGVTDPWENDHLYPLITIDSPSPGAFSTNTKVLVKGKIEGAAPDEFAINHENVALDSQLAFTTMVACDPIGPLLPIEARAAAGDFIGKERVTAIYGESQNEDLPIKDALAFNVTESFLDVLGAAMVDLALNFPFDQLLDKINPIIDFLGVTLEIPDITIGDIEMTLETVDEGLSIDTTITDLTVFLYGEMEILGIPIILDGSATAGVIEFTALATAQSDGQGGATVVMENVSTQLYDFALHLENIPDWLFTLVNALVREAMEFIVDFIFSDIVPEAINALLGAIQIEGDFGDIEVSLGYQSFNIDAGGISGVFEGNLKPLTSDPDAPVAGASLVTPGALPPFPKTSPVNHEPYDLALVIGDDLINRAFFAMTKTGLLQFDIPSPMDLGNITIELTTGSLAGIFPSLENVDPQLPVRVEFYPSAPPVIAPYTLDSKQAMFALAGYNISLYIDTGDPIIGQWEAFSIAFDFAAQAGIILDDQGGISLDLELPVIDAKVIHNQIGEEKALLISWVIDILDTQLDLILDQLSSLTIQLPEILGIKIVPVEIDNGGADKDYLVIYLRFER